MSVLGTPEFMAPELYDEKYDEKVDVYAFGMCVLEMISKETPYSECANAAQIFKRVTSQIAPQVLLRVRNERARNFIQLCLEREPKNRPTVSELLAHTFLEKGDEDDEEVIVDPPGTEPLREGDSRLAADRVVAKSAVVMPSVVPVLEPIAEHAPSGASTVTVTPAFRPETPNGLIPPPTELVRSVTLPNYLDGQAPAGGTTVQSISVTSIRGGVDRSRTSSLEQNHQPLQHSPPPMEQGAKVILGEKHIGSGMNSAIPSGYSSAGSDYDHLDLSGGSVGQGTEHILRGAREALKRHGRTGSSATDSGHLGDGPASGKGDYHIDSLASSLSSSLQAVPEEYPSDRKPLACTCCADRKPLTCTCTDIIVGSTSPAPWPENLLPNGHADDHYFPSESAANAKGIEVSRNALSQPQIKVREEKSQMDVLCLVIRAKIKGKLRDIEFEFNMVNDNPQQVAQEMVSAIGLPESDVKDITETIVDLAARARSNDVQPPHPPENVRQNSKQGTGDHARAKSDAGLYRSYSVNNLALASSTAAQFALGEPHNSHSSGALDAQGGKNGEAKRSTSLEIHSIESAYDIGSTGHHGHWDVGEDDHLRSSPPFVDEEEMKCLILSDNDMDPEDLLDSGYQKLKQDFEKQLHRSRIVFNKRMDNLKKSRAEKEESHKKQVEKHQKDMAEFEKKYRAAEKEQAKRLKELEDQWRSTKLGHREKRKQRIPNSNKASESSSNLTYLETAATSKGVDSKASALSQKNRSATALAEASDPSDSNNSDYDHRPSDKNSLQTPASADHFSSNSGLPKTDSFVNNNSV